MNKKNLIFCHERGGDHPWVKPDHFNFSFLKSNYDLIYSINCHITVLFCNDIWRILSLMGVYTVVGTFEIPKFDKCYVIPFGF